MLNKRRFLYAIYWLPIGLAMLRVVVTMWFLIQNPLGLPLRFLQVIPMLSILIALFMYRKLFSDGVPVITVIAPTLLHAVLIYVFQKKIVLIPFIVLVLLDGIFLVAKGVKANMFPFDIEGEEEEDDFSDMEETVARS